MYKYNFIEMGNNLFVVKRRFKIEHLQPVVDKFGSEEICKAYHCDTLLRGKDGFLYLVDKVEDAKIID
jgi:hypothetical protein